MACVNAEKNRATSIDFIGDIHGHFDELVALLKKLGYENDSGVFRFPGNERMVVFLGDYIDRGPHVRETIDLVRKMRDAGSAIALMGNHEFNALSFWQPNLPTESNGCRIIHAIGGGYLREHSFNKIAIHTKTIEAYKGRRSEFFEMLDFLKTLPFYLETDLFRAQHACFNEDFAKQLKELGIGSFSDGVFDELIARANDQYDEYGQSLFAPIDSFLKGPEVELPQGMSFCDGEGVVRKKARLRWWVNPAGAEMNELCFQPGVDMPSWPVPESIAMRKYYGEQEKPVFFGHYWLKGEPLLLRNNVCCLDFSVAGVAGGGCLAAYRFDGEQLLDPKKFVWVKANG